jgi:molybdopterin synthase sulfur carrier subunit
VIKRHRFNLWAINDTNNTIENHKCYICWQAYIHIMEILLFGITRDIAGKAKLSIPAGEQPQTVGDLKAWLGQQYPAMQQLSSLAVAVDNEYADDSLPLDSNNEIALIPPVSGG